MPVTAGEHINRSQCAALMGVAPTTVDAYIRAGMPASKKGKSVTINSKDAIEWRIERAKSEALKATSETPDVDIRRRREIAEMERAERLNAVEGGEVARIDEMSEAWAEQLTRIGAKLEAIPSRFGMPCSYACAALLTSASPELIEDLRIAIETKLAEAVDELREEIASGSTLPDNPSGEQDGLADAA